MSTENQIVKSSLTEIMSIGKAFHESGLFPDIKSAAQAIVKITAGAEMGIPPFAAMSGIHIIQGKPTVGAGLMAANVKGSGKYDYRVMESTEKVCSIDFFQRAIDKDAKTVFEKIGNSTFTIEDAKKAQTKNLDKFPKNMLFARAISNGVKWFCPDIFNGPVYVPEEMDGLQKTEDVKHEEVKTEPKPAVKKVVSKDFMTKAVAALEAETDPEQRATKLKSLLDGPYLFSASQLAELAPFEAVSITSAAE